MKIRKWTAAMLSICTALSLLTGCGSNEGEAGKDSLQAEQSLGGQAYVYVAKSLESNLEGAGYNLCALPDRVIYTNYYFENETNRMELLSAPIEEDRIGNDTKRLYDTTDTIHSFFWDGNDAVYAIIASSDKEPDWDDPNFNYDQYTRNQNYSLIKLSLEGELLLEQDITADMQAYLNAQQFFGDLKGTVLSDGKIAMHTNEGAIFFDADGKKCGEYHGNGYISSMAAGPDAKVYLCLSGIDVNGLYLTDKSGQNPTSIAKGYINGVFSDCAGSVYVYDNTGIRKLLEDQTLEKVLDWTEVDVVNNYVQSVTALDENRILVTEQDWNNNEFRISLLTKTDASKLQTKTTLNLGMMYSDSSVMADVVAFNKSNDKYRIQVKHYVDDTAEWTDHTFSDALTQLQNDIVAGDGKLDMVLTDPTYMDTLIDKGAVEDLFPYLEASSSVHKEDYIEKVLEACTKKGMLVTLPSTFHLNVVSVKKELMPQAKGWNLTEILDFAEAHPKSDLTSYATKDTVMNFLMTMTAGEFLNMEEGTCHFDHPLFQRMLNYCSKYPDEINWNNRPEKSQVEMIRDDDFLLMDSYMGDFNEVQYHKALYGDSEPNYIGYPNEKGDNGILLSCGNGYSMLTTSREKDGVFAFMEYVASKPFESDFMYSFPAKKSDFESVRKKATTVEYLTDDNGEFILDENGEKINMTAGHMIVSDESGWSYNFREVTEEEANLVEELIALANPADESIDQDIYNIIFEEAQPFFKGQKSVEEVCSIMNNRISLLLKEKM